MIWWKLLSKILLVNQQDFSSYSRIFDKDKDGFLTTDELRKIMKERMAKKDLNVMIEEADSDNDGFINCQGNPFKHLLHLKLPTKTFQSFARSFVRM